jgi:hypothetical protein
MLNVHAMRKTLVLLLLFALPSFTAAAQEPPKPITIAFEVLGDTDQGIAARISFRFAQPPEVPPETGLFLQGSLLQGGQVIRNFRFPIAPNTTNAISTVQTFAEGEVDVEVRLVMPVEEGSPVIVAKVADKFTVARTNKPYIASEEDGADAVLAEGVMPESVGAVKIRAPRRDVAPNLFIVEVDVLPPVKRVEFWVEGKKVLARNAPPFNAELDLGTLPKRVEVRAVGYDAQGRYVDADAFVVNERDTPLELKITRTITPDGVSHFKLSLQNPKGTSIKNVVLYAGAVRDRYSDGTPGGTGVRPRLGVRRHRLRGQRPALSDRRALHRRAGSESRRAAGYGLECRGIADRGPEGG